MLNQAGRLQITNAVFSAMPTYYMCTLEIPKAGTVKKGSFWWRDVLKMLPLFKEMTTVKIKN